MRRIQAIEQRNTHARRDATPRMRQRRKSILALEFISSCYFLVPNEIARSDMISIGWCDCRRIACQLYNCICAEEDADRDGFLSTIIRYVKQRLREPSPSVNKISREYTQGCRARRSRALDNNNTAARRRRDSRETRRAWKPALSPR